ncbi:MAG: PKD domain-containing protein [Crocinitomicaceae bacterium]|nr:PKD domain-containing protein [Crocinitomicaceae bacterium]
MNVKFAFLLLLFTSTLTYYGQIWTGNVDAEWENGANWLTGTVPSSGMEIVIDSLANYSGMKSHPIISSPSSFAPKKLSLRNGGKLRITGPLAQLNVIGKNVFLNNNNNSLHATSLIVDNGGFLSVLADKKLKIRKGADVLLTGGTIIIDKDLEIDEANFTMNESTGASNVTLNSDRNNKGKLKIKCNTVGNSLFDMSGGTFVINGGDVRSLEIDGNKIGGVTNSTLNLSGGTFINLGTTIFKNQNDDSTLINISGGSMTLTENVAIKSAAGKMDINISDGELIFQDNLTLAAQDQITQSGNSTIRFQETSTIQNDGIISCTAGTVIFEGDHTLLNDGDWQFHHIELADGSALSQTSVNRINIGGNWTNKGGLFTSGSNSVTLNGNGIQDVSNVVPDAFYDLAITPLSSVHINTSAEIAINNLEQVEGLLDNDGVVKFVTGYDGNSGVLSGDGLHAITGGNWNNTGTFIAEQSTVLFNGGTSQNLINTTAFNNIEIDNVNGVTVSSGIQNIHGILTPTNGVFNTNNSVVLVSDALGTGSIMTIQPTADIIGDVEMQRFVEGGRTGWRLQSSAIANQTLANWSDDFITAGFNGSDYPSFSFLSVKTYDETFAGSKDNPLSWQAPSHISDPIGTCEGFRIWSGTGLPLTAAFTINNIGPINKGEISKDMQFSNFGNPFEDGWNMFGNPYPCAIDFDSPNWDKTNIDGTFWIWNTDTQTFASWTTLGGVSINGGTPEIASSQAIWVHANASSASLTVQETCKTTALSEFKSTSINEGLMKFKIVGNGWADEAAIRFYTEGTENFDSYLDATKMYSTNEDVPGISTISSGIDYAVNTLSDSLKDYSIPIRAVVGATGNYSIEFSGFEYFPNSACLVFEDLLLDSIIDLGIVSSYDFLINDTTSAPRFLFHMKKPHDVIATNEACHRSNDGIIEAVGNGNGPWTYELFDDSLNLIQSETTTNNTTSFNGISAGQYFVTIENNGGSCVNEIMDSVLLESTNAISATTQLVHPSCFENTDGEATLSIAGGTEPYSVSWSNGENGITIDQLSSGIYEALIEDGNGCLDSISIRLEEPIEVTAEFDITGTMQISDTVYLTAGSACSFNNISNGSAFFWDFGDGEYSSVMNPTHTYFTEGTYLITLNATNLNGCNAEYTTPIVVLENLSVNITDAPQTHEITVNVSADNLRINAAFESNNRIQLKVYNIVGQIVTPTIQITGQTIIKSIDISALSKGIYLLNISGDNFNEIVKFHHR